jgi:glycerol-3-phosphate acyltransferase PlsY
MEAIIIIILSYLLGSISFSYLIARGVAGIDIRQHGSKNAGATNTLRILGLGPAITVLTLDALKGVAAILIAMWWSGDPNVIISAGVAAIIGHNWPLLFGFKGGKGIATTIGVIATLAFIPGLIAGILAILSIVIWRFVSLGSLIFVTLVPVFMYVFDYSWSYIIGAMAIMCLSYLRHRTNISRIIKGEENKLGRKTPSQQ